MNRSSQRQRRENDFVWKRFLTDSKRHDAIEFIEKPNPEIFRKVLQLHGNEWTSETLGRVESLKILMENDAWERRFIPRQKEFEGMPASYRGCPFIGRSYGGSFTSVHSKIVNTLFQDTHRYLDMTSCFPTILCGAFKHLELDALKCYVTNREEIFQGFYADHGINRTDVKKAVMALIGAAPKMPSDFGLGAGAEERVRVFSEHPYMIAIQSELCSIANEISALYPDYYQGVINNSLMNGKSDTAKGRAISFFCHDIEDSIMRTCFKFLQNGFTDDLSKQIIWKFDGALVPKTMVYHGEDVIQGLQQHIFETHGLHVRFSFKDISSPENAYDDCGSDLIVDSYLKWKSTFDLRFVKFLVPDGYGHLQPDGTYRILSYGQSGCGGTFGFITSEENQDFIKRWVADPEKIIYQGLDFAPPPLEVKRGHLNTFRGFAASQDLRVMDKDEIDHRWGMWDKHISLLCNDDDPSVGYLHRHIAHILQRPGIKTGVIVFMRSVQGTGKDLALKVLSRMIGASMVHSAASIKEMFSGKSAIFENKIIVSASESNARDFLDHGEEIKHLATRDTFLVEQKYVKAYTNRCNVNLFVCTNNFGGMNFSTEDRRIFAIQPSGRYANDPAYHQPFVKYIDDPANITAIFRKYMAMDLTGFVPMESRPITVVHKEMSTSSCNPMAFFLSRNFDQWITYSQQGTDYYKTSPDYLRVSNRAFLDQWAAFCEEMKFKNLDTRRKCDMFGTQRLSEAASSMMKYCPLGVSPVEDTRLKIQGKVLRGKIFHISAVKEWIYAVMPREEENEDEEEGGMDIEGGEGDYKAHRNASGEGPSYVVKSRGEVVYGSDDLEEINRFMGHAYIKTLHDGRMVLIHQVLGNKEYEVPRPYDELTSTRLEMKYPWYRKSRIM